MNTYSLEASAQPANHPTGKENPSSSTNLTSTKISVLNVCLSDMHWSHLLLTSNKEERAEAMIRQSSKLAQSSAKRLLIQHTI